MNLALLKQNVIFNVKCKDLNNIFESSEWAFKTLYLDNELNFNPVEYTSKV